MFIEKNGWIEVICNVESRTTQLQSHFLLFVIFSLANRIIKDACVFIYAID